MEGGQPGTSRTRWACGACLTFYQERSRTPRAKPRDRVRIGICPRCAVKARTLLLERAHPNLAALAPALERIGNKILGLSDDAQAR